MSKKGLIASLVIALVATLSLGIYTLVSVFGGNGQPAGPVNTDINVAFRMGDDVEILNGYSQEEGTLKFVLEEGAENPLALDAQTGSYKAEKEGEVSAVVTLDKAGNTNTYKITVYYHGADAGKTADKPYVIANKAHVKELSKALAESNTFECPEYLEFVSDIDLSGENWKPIGSFKNEYHLKNEASVNVNIKGNGKTIKNMNIEVNQDNYTEFLSETVSGTTSKKYMYLGFFGSINTGTVTDLNFENANISVSDEVYTAVALDSEIVEVSIGILSAHAYNVDIIGNAENKSTITGTIEGFSYYRNNANYSGIGGVVGDSALSSVENYKVKLTVENGNVAKNSYIGGVFGNLTVDRNTSTQLTEANVNKIANCEVELDAKILFTNQATVAGLVAEAANITVENSHVTSFKVKDLVSNDQYQEYTAYAAGAIGIIYHYDLTNVTEAVKPLYNNIINNVTVDGLDVDMGLGDAYGFVGILGDNSDAVNSTIVTNSAVKGGTLKGSTVAGFAGYVNSSAKIQYNNNFAKVAEAAVSNLTLKGTRALGFAREVYGVIESTADKKTIIDTTINGLGSVFTDTTVVEDARSYTYVAGAIGTMVSESEEVTARFEGFEVVVVANQSVNYAGVAMYTEDVEIKNVKVDATFTSSNSKVVDENLNVSSTYIVAGVVGEILGGTKVDSVVVTLNVNTGVDKTLSYGAAFVGGVAGRISKDGATITNCVVGGETYFNYSYHKVTFTSGEAGSETSHVATTFNAGGLVGAISSKTSTVAGVDGLSILALTNTSITSNTVDGLTIVADLKELNDQNQLVASAPMNHAGFFRVKSIGALVGTINNEEDFSLIGNTVGTVKIEARTTTFTSSYDVDGRIITIVTISNNKTSTYGASNEPVVETGIDLSKVSYSELA